MAISATTGGTVNNTSAGTSLAFSANTSTTGQAIVVAIAILSSSVTVSSVTDTSGTTYSRLAAITNSSGVRVELWGNANITGHSSNVITVNLSGSALASASYEEYSGVTAFGHTSSGSTGGNLYPQDNVATQDASNWAVTGAAIASSSGDTLTATWGTIRQSIIPALTTAGSALLDATSLYTSMLTNLVRISSSRVWAAASVELRTGLTAVTLESSNVMVPYYTPDFLTAPASVSQTPSYFTVTPIAEVIQGGTVGTVYSETITGKNGTSPYTFSVVSGSLPTGLSLNSSTGVISGTPTASGTSTFTIQTTDANGFTGTQVFQINIVAASTAGGNYGYSY